MVHYAWLYACGLAGFAAGWVAATQRQRYVAMRAAVDELRSVVDRLKHYSEARGRNTKGGDA